MEKCIKCGKRLVYPRKRKKTMFCFGCKNEYAMTENQEVKDTPIIP